MYWKYELTYHINYGTRHVSGYVWATCRENALTRLKDEYGDFSEYCFWVAEAELIEIDSY